MNECDPATSLNGEIKFITDLKQLLERASEMKDAVVPIHCFFPGLGVYLSNRAAVHKNSLKSVERNDSAESKPVSGSLPEYREHNTSSPKFPTIEEVLKELAVLAYGVLSSREINLICSVVNFIERKLRT